MNRRLVTVLVGAAIGACVGALYAWAYLEYRDGLAEERVYTYDELRERVGLPEEPTAVERKRAASLKHQERMAQARAYREQNPGVSWPEAIRRAGLAAQNGGGEVTQDVPA